MQIYRKNPTISPYGGINVIHNTIKKSGILNKIEEYLGKRAPQAEYKYSEVLLSLFYSHYTGGTAMEDVKVLKEKLGTNSPTRICSPDVVGDVCNSLKTPTEKFTTEKGIQHEFNINLPLNGLLAEVLIFLGMLDKEHGYTMDYDNIALENEKYDSEKTYKMFNGYQPGVAFIGKLPVYIENRNGNSPAKYKMAETFERMFTLYNSKGVTIENFRSDSAAYQKEVVKIVKNNTKYFYIRAISSPELTAKCKEITSWQKIEINHQTFEIGETLYCPFQEETVYRVVVSRKLRKDKQMDVFSESAYEYYGIMTNNEILTAKEVLVFYNNRASAEPNFDILNNDFNWLHLPFSFLNQNTVYMILSAISLVIFEWIKKTYSAIVDFVLPKMRMKRFINWFVSVPAKIVTRARQQILILFTEKKYELLV